MPHTLSESNLDFLKGARWYGHKGLALKGIRVIDTADVFQDHQLCLFEFEFKDTSREVYLILTRDNASRFVRIGQPVFLNLFMQTLGKGGSLKMQNGEIRCASLGGWAFNTAAAAYHNLPALTTNSLIRIEHNQTDRLIIKFARRLQKGSNVEVEVNRHLAIHGKTASVPPLRAYAVYTNHQGDQYHIAALFDFIKSHGNGWAWTLKCLEAFIKETLQTNCDVLKTSGAFYHERMRQLGEQLAALHVCLSQKGEGNFGVKKITRDDINAWKQGWLTQLEKSFALIRASTVANKDLGTVRDNEQQIRTIFESSGDTFLKLGYKIRQHGDFHFEQVLVCDDGFCIMDFEGEPLKPYAERAIHYPALKDVAGLLRSLNYAGFSAYFKACQTVIDPVIRDKIKQLCARWESWSQTAFLNGYYGRLKEQQAPFLPLSDMPTIDMALKIMILDKALYEIEYEINNRPDWLPIPLSGILGVLEK
ncbi:MAG: hypothetical protein HQM16_14410 [Deltaproteobacteria bacterium]|nr:hypothetical protein [Deltaproteobacteria bacterium]